MATGPAATAELVQQVDADVARWKEVPLLVESFEEPPANWHRVESPEFRFSIALPCNPELKRVPYKGSLYVTYQCVAEGHPYIVMVSGLGDPTAHGHSREQWLSSIYLGHVEEVKRRAEQMQMETAMVPDHRILYQGVVGRQSIFVARKNGKEAVVTTRLLPGSDGVTISLQSGSNSRQPTREMQRFFNSLKLL